MNKCSTNTILMVNKKECSECGITFSCGITEAEGYCWCNYFPAIFSMNTENDCLCTDCLKKESISKINEYVSKLTPEEALTNKVKDLPKTGKNIEDIDFYIENGYHVFTAWYHLKRGNCCENGCRHCPYGFKK